MNISKHFANLSTEFGVEIISELYNGEPLLFLSNMHEDVAKNFVTFINRYLAERVFVILHTHTIQYTSLFIRKAKYSPVTRTKALELGWQRRFQRSRPTL